MGNITFDNLANRLILSHCTGALKLEGFDQDYRAPYRLRNFHANAGVSLQVSWPLGREATILDRVSMTGDKFIVAAAKVTGNNDVLQQPPCGGCRTVVEYELDWDGNIMDLDITDLHGSAVLGSFKSTLVQFCRLAGLVQPVDIAGHPLSGVSVGKDNAVQLRSGIPMRIPTHRPPIHLGESVSCKDRTCLLPRHDSQPTQRPPPLA